MGHRIVKRVPLDFDAPLDEVWEGYKMPESLHLPTCGECGGDGGSPTYRWLQRTFYDHNVAGENNGWRDKLVQADVDVLVAEDRLREYRQVPEDEQCGQPCDDAPEAAVWHGDPCRRFAGHDGTHHPRPGEWIRVPRTAEEVNAANGPRGQMLGDLAHDSINCWVLAKSRCERLGAPVNCAACDGHGDVGTPEQREAYENWTGTEPPKGEGWQLWETTSEGSPITPVFATARELADYAARHATIFGSQRMSAADWLASFEADSTDVDSMLVLSAPVTPES